MSEFAPASALPETEAASSGTAPAARKRPLPGERRAQILQTLAQLLEQPGGERITTALLARQLDVSEAALYRHFASKAQMFEGLIEFIEHSVFGLVQQVLGREAADLAQGNAQGAEQAARIVALLLQFGEKNPGMVRVMVGDALVLENERLQARMNQFFERFESSLRQALRAAAQAHGSAKPTAEAQVAARLLTDFAVGRLQRFARSGFRQLPTEQLQASLALVL